MDEDTETDTDDPFNFTVTNPGAFLISPKASHRPSAILMM